MPNIDELLHQAGQQWRDALDGQSGASYLDAQPGRHGRGSLVLAVAAVVLVLVGIGAGGYWLAHGSPAQQGAASPTSRPSPDPLLSTSAGQNSPLERINVVPASVATAPGNSGMPWRFLTLSTDGRQITLLYAAGDGYCIKPVGIALTETSSSVTIEPIVHTDQTHSACANSENIRRTVLSLSQPLGHRQLLHPPLGRDAADLSRLLNP